MNLVMVQMFCFVVVIQHHYRLHRIDTMLYGGSYLAGMIQCRECYPNTIVVVICITSMIIIIVIRCDSI
jgi:hypothetical protein